MSDRQSLLAAVSAAPEDDGVRLVYADWLEEHGERERADFIRTQINRDSLPDSDPKRDVLKMQEKEWLKLHMADWLRHLPEWAKPHKNNLIADEYDWFGFRRGFLQGVCAPEPNLFLSTAPAVFASEPITHLYFGGNADALLQLADSPEFLGLIALRFGHYVLGDYGVVLFSRLPPMPRLRHLWMYKNEIGDRGLRALAKWPGLATVEDLELGFNNFKSPGAKALIASPFLSKLKRLDLSDSFLAPKTKKLLKDRFGDVVDV